MGEINLPGAKIYVWIYGEPSWLSARAIADAAECSCPGQSLCFGLRLPVSYN